MALVCQSGCSWWERHEPTRTLAEHRRWDGKVWFGINLIPEGPGEIRVGDEVRVIGGVQPGEPLR